MLIIGLVVRRRSYCDILLFYLVSLVCFSSAIANQYLVIPMVVLSVYRKKTYYWAYVISGGIYCLLNGSELHLLQKFLRHLPVFSHDFLTSLSKTGGIAVTFMTLVLFLLVVDMKFSDRSVSLNSFQ